MITNALAGNFQGLDESIGYCRFKRRTRCSVRKSKLKTLHKVSINVSGTIYTTYARTLNRYPETLLGNDYNRAKLCFNSPNRQIFFDRNRASFETILFFYQSKGCLARPPDVSMADFITECRFYQLPERAIKSLLVSQGYLYTKPKILKQPFSKLKKNITNFFERPKNNMLSFLYFLFSYALILLSVATFCVNSELLLWFDTKKYAEYLEIATLVEISLHLYFAIEFVTRLCGSADPWSFMLKILNILELIVIFGFLIFYILPIFPGRNILINTVRVLRTTRLARAARISKSIKVASTVFKESVNDVLAVIFCVLIITIFCGSIMYYVEVEVAETQFTSIPMAMWWALETVVCLGYGDIVPNSVIGKLIASPILFLGVVCVTVLLLSLGGRFFDQYSKELTNKGFLPETEKVDYEIHY